jgi:site-specific DNA recombinase
MKPTPTRTLRCAIYTRVSTDQGLEQEFNSLDAQREAAQAYVKSQAHEGWRLIRDRYDDGGFSGGSMERPALQTLLTDVKQRRIDTIVVYKVDRLTRSLADFAKLVELFDEYGVSFVSVTQSFNTTTSMGRLTLNVLLSFAQFEREVTGERIRDKIAASKKKGMWVGGVVPLGYEVKNKKLIVNDAEAATVRMIFERYLALGSLPALQRELRAQGIVTRKRILSSGKTIGGTPLTNGPLAYMLRNRVYLGEINHRDQSYRGEHPSILDQTLFDAVQAKLDENRRGRTLTNQRSRGHCHGALGLRSLWRLGSQGNEENQLQPVSLPARDHSAGDLALSPVHLELPRRRRFVGGTRHHGLLRDHSALGESFRADDRGGFAQAPPQT